MASFTSHFGIGFFDFGDQLGLDYSGQIEVNRFVFIDKQLYGLMSIFGNGVIEGWEVSAGDEFSVDIGPGTGNINFISGRTTFSQSITNLTPNSVLYIYAKSTRSTLYDEGIIFITDSSDSISDPNYLLLSKITTGNSTVTSVDNSVRQEIGFLELIKAAIRQHHHRGGALYPSKIDLSSEVKGQLPSFRIADFDASKITSGTFNLAQMPLIDHQSLLNVGLLTHPQLDSFVKTLESSNKELFGEIGTSNLLQLIIAIKLVYEDPSSALYIGKSIDENMINEFIVIPGITDDSRIDYINTNAVIDTNKHEIRGIPSTGGTSFYVTYDNKLSWQSAYSLNGTIISGDYVVLGFDSNETSNILSIEGFESAACPGQILSEEGDTEPCSSTKLFEKQIIPIGTSSNITADSNAFDVIKGFYAGKFSTQQSFRIQYVKTYETSQDWTNYSILSCNIKCSDQIHGEVKIYLTGTEDTDTSIEYTLLDRNYATIGPNGFESRQIDLSLIPFRDRIKSIIIYSDDTTNPFTFVIDSIEIQTATLLPEYGTIKIRYSSNSSVVFSSIEWNSIEPTGTDISVRAKAAHSTTLLNRTDFTPNLINGNLINLEGSDLEIEVTLYPNSDRSIGPTLLSLRILVLSDSEIDGYATNTVEEFSKGTIENITINSPASLSLSSPISVGSYYFSLANIINQISSTGQAESSSIGFNLPISPNQIYKSVEDFGAANPIVSSSLFEPKSVIRTYSKNLIIADTFNDRVVEINEDGDLVSGIGSINYQSSVDLPYPIASSFDKRTNILYIVWSKSVDFKNVNVSKITIQSTESGASKKVKLVRDIDKILGYTSSELQTVSNTSGQIMPIYISDQNSGYLQYFSTNNTRVLLDPDVSTGAIIGGISTDSVIYKKIYNAKGIPCYVGNFAYVDSIFSPTWADRTSQGNLIICNGTIAVKNYKFDSGISESLTQNTNPPSIIEFNSDNQVVFGSDIMKFSPFVPGRAKYIGNNQYLIGGLLPTGSPGDSSNLDFRVLTGNQENKQKQKDVLSSIILKGSVPFSGGVVIFDKIANASVFQYSSPEGMLVSDVDMDSSGLYVVAESNLSQSGRVVKLDDSGNVVFSYGEGSYGLINDISVKDNGDIIIST